MIVNKPKKKKKLSRYTILLIIMGVIFSILTLKIAYIQLYKHEDYKEEANSTSTKFVSEKAPRGEILDQNGNVLATNIQTYALTYTATSKADKAFYNTMDSIFQILKSNNDTIQDDLKLKLDGNNKWYIDYDNTDADLVKAEDIRFKRDRGLNEQVEKKLGYNSKEKDLTDEQISNVNNDLEKITPDEVFYYLVKLYDLIDLINPNPTEAEQSKYNKMSGKQIADLLYKAGYTNEQLRDYLVVKDALKIKSIDGYKSVTICSNLQKSTADIIFQKLNELPGIDVTLQPTRYYPNGTLASSVIGYLSSISESNEEKYTMKGYDASTDLVGVSGIESAFEDQLRGVTGGTTVKVNSSGRVTEELFKLEAYPGNNVHLTLDQNIQSVAVTALDRTMASIRADGKYANCNRGAVVVMEVNTGRILALASLPSYDPNNFAISGKLTSELNKEYFAPDLESFGTNYIKSNNLNKSLDDLFPKDSNGNREDIYDLYPRPLFNYATQGLIPPGSTFKPITGLAGLETNAITTTETIHDYVKFDRHPELFNSQNAPGSDYNESNGDVDITKALEVSCNYYFYETAYRMYQNAAAAGSKTKGLNAIATYAWRFGLGVDPNGQQRASTGIEISENFGQVYNFTSYKRTLTNITKFNLRDGLEGGSLRGYSFVPFDYSDSDNDSEALKAAKTSLKKKITKRLDEIDPDSKVTISGSDAFAKTIIDDIKNIMSNSENYKKNVEDYKSQKGVNVDINNEATKIANAISLYVVYDVGSEMVSPAQEIYAAIGQGMNTFTPVQLVQYVSTLVNGGTRYKAHLVDEVTDPNGKVLQKYGTEVLDHVNFSDETRNAIIAGMKKVTQEDGGTASGVFMNFPIDVGGKTGTADFRADQTDLGRSPYATFISFAPADNPKIAVVAVAYDGGHGASISPVAKAVYEQYFKNEILAKDPSFQFEDYIK